MRHVRWLVILTLSLIPGVSHAIQLHWSSGADTLTFTEETRAILVLRADSAEVTLPSEWRLLWVGDSTEVQVVALDSLEVCEGDTAQVYGVDGSSTPEDSTAHRVTAHFCSGGSGAAEQATFVLDLPAWGRGKCKVVALDPADSSNVLESNEVTFNGGIDDNYEATMLAASSAHTSLTFQLTAIGSGLQGVQTIALHASDASWTVPLTVTSSSDNSLTAVASLAALVPNCIVSLTSSGGSAASVPLAADATPYAPESGGRISFFREGLLSPAKGLVDEIQPKDFAFAQGFVGTDQHYALHLFYTRQNQELSNNHLDELTTKNIGHVASGDFSWAALPDTTFLPVRPGHFDNGHVWAPTIVLHFPDYYMFYTGVDSLAHQRIGVTKTRDFTTWDRADTSIFDVTKSNWAARGAYLTWVNCRDPFVLQDPDNPNIWLMYYAAVDSASALVGNPQMAVGVARSYGDMYSWKDSTELVSTMRPVFGNQTTLVESPHVFRHNGQWWMPYTVNQDSVFFETTSQGPAAAATEWNGPVCLRSVVQGHPTTQQFYHASEYLKVNQSEYLAAYDDASMAIDIQQIVAVDADSVGIDSLNLGYPEPADVHGGSGPPDKVRLVVSGLAWGASAVNMRIDLPVRGCARLVIYDVLGRRCRTLIDGEVLAGSTHIAWDGRDQENRRIASGVYFVHLSCASGTATQRTVVVR